MFVTHQFLRTAYECLLVTSKFNCVGKVNVEVPFAMAMAYLPLLALFPVNGASSGACSTFIHTLFLDHKLWETNENR